MKDQTILEFFSKPKSFKQYESWYMRKEPNHSLQGLTERFKSLHDSGQIVYKRNASPRGTVKYIKTAYPLAAVSIE